MTPNGQTFSEDSSGSEPTPKLHIGPNFAKPSILGPQKRLRIQRKTSPPDVPKVNL